MLRDGNPLCVPSRSLMRGQHNLQGAFFPLSSAAETPATVCLARLVNHSGEVTLSWQSFILDNSAELR